MPRPDSSLPCSFSPQGLLCPAWIHPYLALLLHRDDFRRSDASLSCSFAPQRLFPLAECISILLFSSTGMISPRSDVSLSCSFSPQGLFLPPGCISILLFCSTKIISAGRMHLYLALFFHRDDFAPVRCVPTSEKPRNLCFLICLTPRWMRYGSKASYAYPRHSPHTAHRIMVPL